MNKPAILKNPDVYIGLFVLFCILGLIFFIVDYLQTDENLKDAKKVSEIKERIKNEIKKLDNTKNIALLKTEDWSKPNLWIKFSSKYITQSEKDKIWTNFKAELNKNNWKFYSMENDEFYEKAEFFCKDNLKGQLSIMKKAMWDKENTYFVIEMEYNSKDSRDNKKPLPQGCN